MDRNRASNGRIGRVSIIMVLILGVVGVVSWPSSQHASGAPQFSDGFESQDLAAWSGSSGIAIQSHTVHGGAYAAINNASVAWAERRLTTSTPEVHAELWFRFDTRSDAVWLARLRTSTGTPLMKVLVNVNGRLAYRNDVVGVTRTSTVTIAVDRWYHLELHTLVGNPGRIDVSLDGSPVANLSGPETLGTASIGRFEIGNRPTGKSYSLAIDDVAVGDGLTGSVPMPPEDVRRTRVDAEGVLLAWSPPSSGADPTAYTVYRDNLAVGEVSAPSTEFLDRTSPGSTRSVYTVVSITSTGARSEPSSPLVVPTFGFDPTSDVVVYAVGDIACPSWATVTATTCRQRATSDIPFAGAGDVVIVLGDNQYEQGTTQQFAGSYAPTWGRVVDVTLPIPGNHEYKTAGATGYFDYFGARAGDPKKGYYSSSSNDWDLIAVNSNCGVIGGCGSSSPQFAWLTSHLDATPSSCSLAYWHHPRYSSGSEHGSDTRTQAMWSLLARRGADVVLQGHEHNYERFRPMDGTGAPNEAGIRSFVVGTGGKSLYGFASPLGTSVERQAHSFGVLKLTLHDGWYDWLFVPEWGSSYSDAGSGACR